MKKWQCTVCKYIHEGDEPPENCPICGVGREKFVLLADGGEAEETQAPAKQGFSEHSGNSAKEIEKWICAVCKYDHEGSEPPDVCPVCGAPREKFVFLADGGEAEEAQAPAKQGSSEHSGNSAKEIEKWICAVCKYDHEGSNPPDVCPVCGASRERFEPRGAGSPPHEPPVKEDEAKSSPNGYFTTQILNHHLHPISVHMPNGVIPVSVLFVICAVFLQISSLTEAAFYNLVAVLLALPIVWITGVVEWRKRYGGVWTSRFITKIISGLIVTVCAAVLVGWHLSDPKAMSPDSPAFVPVLLLNVIMLGATVVAGHVGGKFVFRK